MKHYDEVTSQVTRKVLVRVTCDVCGAVHGSKAWPDDHREFDRVTIAHEYGEAYGDSVQMSKLALDACPACFKKKILPFLASLGVVPRYEETHW